MISNFVFSSVGDNTNFNKLWINSNTNSNYHIYIIYYGDNDEIYNEYKSNVHYIEKRKASKFQNFKYFYDKYPEIIEKYDRFFILDDDIEFGVEDINKMFDISTKYDLQICGPSFTHDSKISHKITINKNNTLLTYTNFVEVNVPLFTKEALDKFINILDSNLIGYGIDIFYIWCNGVDREDAYAIVHAVTCKNPHDNEKKTKKRELEILECCKSRRTTWEKFAISHGCPYRNIKIKEYKNIPPPK
jgi:hypothetical protein